MLVCLSPYTEMSFIFLNEWNIFWNPISNLMSNSRLCASLILKVLRRPFQYVTFSFWRAKWLVKKFIFGAKVKHSSLKSTFIMIRNATTQRIASNLPSATFWKKIGAILQCTAVNSDKTNRTIEHLILASIRTKQYHTFN